MLRNIAAAERWRQLESGRVRHPYEGVVLLLALLMLPAVLIQDSGLHSPWGIVADALGTVVWLILTAELALTLYHATDRKKALRVHWHDAVVVIVIFPLWAPFFAAAGPGWLRGWRLARLLSVGGRVFRAERLLTRRHGIPYVAAMTTLIVTIAGIAVHETDPDRFPNVWRGLWFAIVTVTTVGYGDTFPTSPGGRAVAAGLMVIGIGFLGLATAAIASHFVNADADEKHAESVDNQELILRELKRINERLDRLEAR